MKSKKTAVTSFVLSLFSFIPLINFVIAPSGVYFGIKALIEIKEKPELYCGRAYAFAGLIISAFVTITAYSWLILKIIGKI